MALVDAIKKKTVREIKELVTKKGIPVDETWSDYKALNIAISHGRKEIAKFLLEKDCRVNKILVPGDKPTNTPLHHAVIQRDNELVGKLLIKNASVVAVNCQGNSPLHIAFKLRCENIIDNILDFIQRTAALKNLKNNRGLTHFHIACTRNNANIVISYINTDAACLSDSVSKNLLTYYAGYTVLQFAMQSNSPLIFKIVLEKSKDLSSSTVASLLNMAQQELECAATKVYLLTSCTKIDDNIDMSQFHIACMQKNSNVVKTFLNCGAPVNKPINEQTASCPLYTPLHLAVEANCKESIQLLLEHGADPDLCNTKLMTPLHLGLYNDNIEILNLLYEQAKKKEHRTNLTDCYGLRYFHVAVAMNDFEFVFKFLVEDQDVNARVLMNSPNFSGYTPLHFAVRYGHLEMSKLLIKSGAHVNTCDAIQDGTPLHIAFSAGHTHLISLLIEHQSRVDCLRPFDKKTMLHLLVEKYRNTGERDDSLVIFYVKQLIFDGGVNVNAQDKDGNTALHYACTKISVCAPCAQELIECGADINIVNAMGVTPFEVSFYDDYCNDPADYLVLYNHISKLKELELPVSEKNYECCAKLLKERAKFLQGAICLKNRSLMRRHEKRVSELKKMKNIELWPNVSLYDFLQKNSLGLRALGPEAHLTTKIKIKCFKRDFPYFGYFIDLQWRRLKLYSS